MWTCLEIVLWGNSNLCCQQSGPLAKHRTGVAPPRRNSEAPPINLSPWKQQEAAGILPEVLWCISMKSWHARISRESQENHWKNVITKDRTRRSLTRTSKELQGEPMPSHKSAPVKYHMTFHLADSRKNTTCLFSAKHPFICLLQQNILSEDSFQKDIMKTTESPKKPEVSTSNIYSMDTCSLKTDHNQTQNCDGVQRLLTMAGG